MNKKFILWFTGLSGSGKSTVSQAVKDKIPDLVLLDGDVLRTGLCSDLGFSMEDRRENNRRLLEVCRLFQNNGKNVITAFISPIEEVRLQAKDMLENCTIIYCRCSLEKCEERDVKGLYKKARAGEIKEFTGISSAFEEPAAPDLILDTEKESIEESVQKVMDLIRPAYDI